MEIQPLDILKWIGIVLAAGFVGYFGRYIAMQLIGKVHKTAEPGGTPPPATGQAGVNDLKLEKKLAKQAAKQAKKAGKKQG